MKTIARRRSKVKKKAVSKKAAKKKAARSITRKTAKKAAKKAAVKKAAVKKKPAIKKRPVKKAAAKKRPVKKAAVKKAVVKKRPIKKAAVKKPVKKKPTKKRPSDITQRPAIKGLSSLDRLAELLYQQKREELGLKAKIPRAAKKGKRKIVSERGPLRALVERTLARPMAQAQMIERLEDKLPVKFFQDIENWVETEESIIIQRLAAAEQVGVFDEEARENALEFDWDLRDVYELWHSPDVYF